MDTMVSIQAMMSILSAACYSAFVSLRLMTKRLERAKKKLLSACAYSESNIAMQGKVVLHSRSRVEKSPIDNLCG